MKSLHVISDDNVIVVECLTYLQLEMLHAVLVVGMKPRVEDLDTLDYICVDKQYILGLDDLLREYYEEFVYIVSSPIKIIMYRRF